MYSIESIFGTLAFTTSIIGLLPQIYKSHKTKSMHDVSMLLLVNWFMCSLFWVIHEIHQRDLFVIWSNIFGGTTALIAIVQKLYYDRCS